MWPLDQHYEVLSWLSEGFNLARSVLLTLSSHIEVFPEIVLFLKEVLYVLPWKRPEYIFSESHEYRKTLFYFGLLDI